jgi:hypothetical protein
MQGYINAVTAHPDTKRLGGVLRAIVAAPALHARFVNTLSRMEYIGVRKMLKSRRSERMDLDGLQHMLDEGVHALRLKKAATALGAAAGVDVSTFAEPHTLAGSAGEAYFQALDHRAEDLVADLPEAVRAEANYLLTSAVIEVRAQVFYPLYDSCLTEGRAGFSVAAITKDEDRHLSEMKDGLARVMDNWPARLEAVLSAEQTLFGGFLDAVEMALGAARRAA